MNSKNTIKILMMISMLFSIYSCSNIPKGEQEIAFDAEPPKDYNPVFIQRVKDFSPYEPNKPKVIIKNIDTKNPNNIKVYFHLIEGNSIYLTGAFSDIMKKYWCVVEDSINGKIRQINNYTMREISEKDFFPYSLAIVLDHSGSMGEWRAEAMQNAIGKLIADKRDFDEYAIIKYDSKVVTEVPLTQIKENIQSQFQKIGLQGFGGMTAISNSILTGIEELKKSRGSKSKAIIIFTDGFDNSSTVSADNVINLAKQNNISINTVDFGEYLNPDYLKRFAEETGGIHQRIYKTEEFDLVFKDLYKRLQNFYSIEFKTQEYGIHNLKIKLCLPDDTLNTYITFDNTPDIGTIALINVYFDFDKATIQKNSDEAIDAVFALMKAFPNMVIEIRGHTDSLNSTGDPNYNLKLSQRRADAVKQALIRKGISADRIQTIGYGEKQPIADNKNEEGRALNRRTEFKVIKK
jgi:outer membrane protein OmpA-like peptidoglycan-associated protein